MSYAFMCLAFVIQIVSMLLALRTLETETVFMGIPLASLSLYYFFAAILLWLYSVFPKCAFKACACSAGSCFSSLCNCCDFGPDVQRCGSGC